MSLLTALVSYAWLTFKLFYVRQFPVWLFGCCRREQPLRQRLVGREGWDGRCPEETTKVRVVMTHEIPFSVFVISEA